MIRLLLSLVAAVGCLSMGTANAQWGTLRGRVEFEGELPAANVLTKGPARNLTAGNVILNETLILDEQSKGVANVAVWLTKKPAKSHPELAKPPADVMEVQIADRTFEPHVLVLRTDQQLKLINREGAATSVASNPIKNSPFTYLLSPKGNDGDQKK